MGTKHSTNDEWIELYNNSDVSIDLTGWTLRSKTGSPPTPNIVMGGSLGPFGYFLLERTNDTVISDISADIVYTGGLNNEPGELLELRNAQGDLVDTVDGSQAWYAGDNTTKVSMERIHPSQSGQNQSNWATFSGTSGTGHDNGGNPILGTPRARNSVAGN